MKKLASQPLRVLLIATIFCLLLVIARTVVYGQLYYLFLAWNLFLAWMPVFFVLGLKAATRSGEHFLFRLALLGGWMVFMPNAPYILTDLFHLKFHAPVPLWYDLLLLISFGWTGLLLGLWSLKQASIWVDGHFRSPYARWFLPLMIVASAYGVYLGRFERWNSWDLLQHPFAIGKDVLESFTRPRAIGMTLLFSVFLSFAWWSFAPLFKTAHDEHKS